MIPAPMQENAPAPLVTLQTLEPWMARVRAIWRWVQEQGRRSVLQGKSRRLRVSETVSLGEKRFLSIVEVDGQAFLVGGSSVNVALLASLENNGNAHGFGNVLAERWPERESA